MLLIWLKALADETRLKIVKTLFSGKKTVTEITRAIGKSQPNTSLALKQLLHAGIVLQEKKGKNIYYSLRNRSNIKKIFELIKK